MRVTDLEKFSLEQIWRPYQTKMGFGEPRLERAPFGLDETARLLSQPSDWSAAVLSRLHAIGVTFPPYIKHPLVDVVGSVRSKDGRRPRRCRHCGAGFLGNCGAHGAEIPREQCQHSGQGGGDGE